MKYLVGSTDTSKQMDLKEKSKIASKTRRERENSEFMELASLLPLPTQVKEQLDKASIIRLTTSYLRLRELYPHGMRIIQHPENKEGGSSEMMETIDGFVFALAPEGLILYISENVSMHLGMAAIDMTGHSIYDFILHDDHNEMRDMLTVKHDDTDMGRTFSVRMKCTLPKRTAGLTQNGYKVIHCSGHLKYKASSPTTSADIECFESLGLIAIGNPLLPNGIPEIKMGPNMFMFRASMEFDVIFVDAMVHRLTGHEPKQIVQNSIYQYIHPLDLKDFQEAHKELLKKGQVKTKFYRFKCVDGGYVFMQSLAVIVTNSRTSQPRCIVSVNYIMKDCPSQCPESQIVT
ncbi:PREDICTED: single-minded homolog 1-like [Nicrophorus vespilloides]|uniref:Single-minded homolog 1-like n=1 Tax=Nicrophorus vespilloides TaxID=110193 RepID=A0ABM1MGT4_NICVS|nr:PREDICTED: single-minded homolog 1-like [Nicrophorus vespilloides]